MIKVVGLGLKDGDLSLKGAVAIDNADKVIVKTALTDTYKFFTEENIPHETLDGFYESSEDFDDLDSNIAKFLLSLKDKNIVYCVNGNGADDRSVILGYFRFEGRFIITAGRRYHFHLYSGFFGVLLCQLLPVGRYFRFKIQIIDSSCI